MDLVGVQLVTADVVEAEEQVVDPVVHLLKTHVVFVQRVADEHLAAKHPNGAVTAHSPHQVVGRIVVGLDALGHASGRGLVDLRRSLHAQRFVRADLVELLAKAVELLLLTSQAAGGRDGCFLLQRAVHPLVDPVLLRFPGFNQLGVDAQLDEPHRQLGEPCQGAGGEGRAIVGADAVGEPVGLKEAPEVLDGPLEGDGRVSVDAKNVAGGQIANRQREAVLSVLQSELALVVRGPDVVGALRNALGTPRVSAPIPAPGVNQSVSGQDPSRGGDHGEVGPGMALVHQVEELGRTPVGVRLAECDELLDDRWIGLPRAAMGATGLLVEAFLAVPLEAVDPFVGGPPRDAEAFGEVGDGVVAQPEILEKPLSLLAHGNTFPGHGGHLPLRKCYLCPENMCYRCLEKILLPMSWSRSVKPSLRD